jgi:multidrug resistance efflux pump
LQPGVSPAARQIAQSSFNRAIQDISKQVDEELEKPDRELRMRPITDEITRLAEEKDRLEKLEAKILMNFGEVRRFQNAYEGYRAELAVVKHGSPAQKSKLVQLYECENETL